jgi:hypothetical protein
MSNSNVTHTQEQIMAIESASSGLIFSGYMQAGDHDGYNMLIPVFMKSDKSREERTARIMRLNKET